MHGAACDRTTTKHWRSLVATLTLLGALIAPLWSGSSAAAQTSGGIDIATSVLPDPVTPGGTATVTIDVTNNTGQSLGVIDVRLSNDDGFAFTATYQGSPCLAFPDNFACELATVAGGETRTIVAEVDVASTASTGVLGEIDVAAQSLTPSGFNGSASQAINVQRLLQIDATVAPDPTPVGETALVTVTVTNDLGEAVDALRADISAPDGTVFTATVGGSACADFTTFLTCVRASAAPGETLVFEVQVPIPTDANSGPFTSLTIVATPVQNGDNGPTTEATVPIEAVILAPVLTLAHTVTPDVVVQGGQTTHTIVVTNTGNATATDIVVELPHPTGVEHTSSTVSAGTHEVPERQWTVPPLSAGESHTIEIVRTHTDEVAPGAVEHSATVSATGPTGAQPPVAANVIVTVIAPALPETGNSTMLVVAAAMLLGLGFALLSVSRAGRRPTRIA